MRTIVVGRLQAIDELKDSKNHETVEKLSHALNYDRFYAGVPYRSGPRPAIRPQR